MEKVHFHRLKNGMLLANMVSNLFGLGANMLLSRLWTPLAPQTAHMADRMNSIFSPCAFLVGLILTLVYERPLRTYINGLVRGRTFPDELAVKARRTCLNEPFFLIAMDFGIWLLAAILFSVLVWLEGGAGVTIKYVFFLNLHTGLITSIVAFFVLEHILQDRLAPFLFPEGGLFKTPKTLRIRIGTRLSALLIGCNIIPFIATIGTVRRMAAPVQNPFEALDHLSTSLMASSFVFIATGIWMTVLVTGNLTRPLRSIINVLREVRRGNFDTKVHVTSNDEIGYTGDVINQMTVGLKERDLIKEMFGRYVAPEIRDEILSGRIPLDGEIRAVTVLFADLRDFTPLTEAIPPKEVVKIINLYFKEMEDAIQRHHGLVLQFIGDEIEAVFGAPLARENHPVLAVRAGLEMAVRLRHVNDELTKRGQGPLRHGIGIHTGEVLAANIGSPNRLSYALVGETVNLASRLEGLNKTFGTEIIASGTTCAQLNGAFSLTKLPETHIKGIAKPIDIYSIA
jgi:adenylate cyclase